MLEVKPKIQAVTGLDEDVGPVFVRVMTSQELWDWLSFKNKCLNEGKQAEATARLVVLTCCDAEGLRHFQDGDMDKAHQLRADVGVKVVNAALALNKVAPGCDDDLKNS